MDTRLSIFILEERACESPSPVGGGTAPKMHSAEIYSTYLRQRAEMGLLFITERYAENNQVGKVMRGLYLPSSFNSLSAASRRQLQV